MKFTSFRQVLDELYAMDNNIGRHLAVLFLIRFFKRFHLARYLKIPDLKYGYSIFIEDNVFGSGDIEVKFVHIITHAYYSNKSKTFIRWGVIEEDFAKLRQYFDRILDIEIFGWEEVVIKAKESNQDWVELYKIL